MAANDKDKTAEEQAQAKADQEAKAAQAKADQEKPTAEPNDDESSANVVPTSEAVAFAKSEQAATGKMVEVPKTPEAIAEQGTALGLAGDHATGGNPPEDDPGNLGGGEPSFDRLWAMDADHTTKFRNDPDCLKPDASVQR